MDEGEHFILVYAYLRIYTVGFVKAFDKALHQMFLSCQYVLRWTGSWLKGKKQSVGLNKSAMRSYRVQ